MPKTNKEFNQAEYEREYHKKHYKNLAGTFTKEEAAQVEDAVRKSGLTVSKYIKAAVFEKIEREKSQE